MQIAATPLVALSPRRFTLAVRRPSPLPELLPSLSTPRLPPARLRPLAIAGSRAPLIAAGDQWGNWAFLLCAAAFALWSEEHTTVGRRLSSTMVSIILGLAASAGGVVASTTPAGDIVMKYLLPVAVPLLLFRADLRRIAREAGRLLGVFLIGSAATVCATIIALKLFPMKLIGEDSWKLAAALMSSYIGGAVNYVAVSEAFRVSPSVAAAGVAADNLICVLYFLILFSLASTIPAEASAQEDTLVDSEIQKGDGLPIKQSAAAIAIAFIICKVGTCITTALNIRGGDLPCITAIIVALATIFTSHLGQLAGAAESIALILLQLFFVILGTNGNVTDAVTKAPSIFAFAFVQVALHLVAVIGIGRLLGIEQKQLLIASNANIGGPTTACAMASAKGWRSLLVPSVLVGIFGIATATFLGIGIGHFVLRRL